MHMRTLDYLGLAETPNPPQAQLAGPSYMANHPIYSSKNRWRSYSVNNKEGYSEIDDQRDANAVPINSRYAAALQDQLDATNAAILEHNRAVEAFATRSRPRASTAGGVLDTASTHLMQSYAARESEMGGGAASPGEMQIPADRDYDKLPQAMAGMGLARSNSHNAGDEPTLEGPTSALWLGGVPTSTTATTLIALFKDYGHILSARVLTHKNCGFVNFDKVESAISAKASMNGSEIFPGAGSIRINFAKPPSSSNTPGHDGIYPSPSPDILDKGHDASGALGSGNQADDSAGAALGTSTPTMPPLADLTTDILDMVGEFEATDDEKATIAHNVQSAIQYTGLIDDISPVPEASHARVHDAPKLRDIRKRIDNQLLSQPEIENIAIDMLPEIAELAADYLGNTVVQKLFEQCSNPIRDAMLDKIAPHLAEVGTHKNGTWAAQKIIDVCETPAQMSLIRDHLLPYTVPLFSDQFGNYVIQCCLKFGPPYNDFVFEVMLSRMWEVSQGRFGARAMRACLESHYATKTQQKMLASAIALRAAQLATNANSALLLTWYLDTCTFPQRRSVMSPRLVPHLVYLCTHKVAYLTVLKIINQKAEAGARDTILQALFFTPNDQTLEAILSDHQSGATLIFKILTTPFFDEAIRSQVVENVKNVLVRIKAQPSQGYKRLMDEVGLSTRSAGPNREAVAGADRQRPSSRHANMNGQQQSHQGNKGFYSPMPVGNGAGFDNGYGAQRADVTDLNAAAYQPYMYGAPGGHLAQPVGMAPLQYQQGMMNRATPQMAYNYAPMQTPFPPFASGPAPVDQYRQPMQNGSPIQPGGIAPPPPMQNGQASFAPPGFNTSGYGYGGMAGAQGMGYMQQDQHNQNHQNRPPRRGGRVRIAQLDIPQLASKY